MRKNNIMNHLVPTSPYLSSFNFISAPVLSPFYEENIAVKIPSILLVFNSLPLCPEVNIIKNLSICNFCECFIFYCTFLYIHKLYNYFALYIYIPKSVRITLNHNQ